MEKPKKLPKRTTMKENAGKLLLDLGKLTFGSMFLGGVLRGEVPQLLLVIAGFTGAAICCIAGLFLSVKEKNPGEE